MAIGADRGAWQNYFGSMQFSAFLGCVTLIFALNGCLTRIRWRQDSNWQKVEQRSWGGRGEGTRRASRKTRRRRRAPERDGAERVSRPRTRLDVVGASP